ncbi:1,1-dichloroethane dehalogenase [Dehalobacter sp. MCB1]|uniref:1,1-dichloroethane dehalogenase n=1 Tax=unclassified Dehalobacter TaxID=2635733 RepID=UPI000E6BA741|nr:MULTISPECIES: 1,1-dichloroethane dehalogenase [unclassified Dehalobacter]RJE47245.1 1,1-dichloroethane dehalogenase [Dehalobacter sp. MCB1]TCX54895.1 1,1-dichloroethane dehalogenase [Dehalobacter sp. 12DCB1]
MALMTFILGLLVAGFGWGVNILRKSTKYSITWLGWAGIVLSFMVLLFAISWSWSCLLEGSTRSAGVGILMFGAIAVVIGAITRVIIIRGIPTSKKNHTDGVSQSA